MAEAGGELSGDDSTVAEVVAAGATELRRVAGKVGPVMATLVTCPKCGGRGWFLLNLLRDDPDAWEWCRLCHGDGAVTEADVMIHELALLSEDC